MRRLCRLDATERCHCHRRRPIRVCGAALDWRSEMDLFAGHIPELIIVLVVILIIWGPGKLPDIGAAVGLGIREFRKASAETRDAMRAAAAEEPAVSAPAQAPPVQPAETEPAPSPSSGGSSGPG